MRFAGWTGQWLDRWQVRLYLAAIAAGLAFGLLLPAAAPLLEHAINPLLGALLFVTFLQVPVAELWQAIRDRRFLATVTVLNFGVVPAVIGVMFWALPADQALRIGVLLVLLCPCVDYVVVFTGLAGGAQQQLLAATPVLLIAQMILTPVYLLLFMGRGVADVVDPRPFVTAFLVLIVIPLGLAWILQTVAARIGTARRASEGFGVAMVPLMMAVLAVVVASQIPLIDDRLADVAAVIPFYVGFLIVMGCAGVLAARLARLSVKPARAAVFSGATRNSLVVLPLALSLPPGLELAAAAIVTQTLVELIGMVVYVRLLPRLIPDPMAAA